MLPPAVTYKRPLLILDRDGLFARAIIESLSEQHTVILLTNIAFSQQKNIVVLPFGRRVPQIPNNTFSSIIAVDLDEVDIKNFGKQLMQKAKDDGGIFYLINTVYHISLDFLKLYKSIYNNTSLLLYADVFSDKRKYINRVEDLLHAAVTDKQLLLPNSGLNLCYPTAEQDIVHWFFHVFKNEKPGQVFCLFSPVGTTELSLARLIHLHNSDTKIKLEDKGKRNTQLLIPSTSIFTATETYQLDKRIKELNFARLKHIDEPLKTIQYKRKNVSRFSLSPVFVILIVLSCSILSFPFITAFLAKQSVEQSIGELLSGNTVKAKTFAKAAEDGFVITQRTDLLVGWVGDSFGFSKQIKIFTEEMRVGQQGSNALQFVADGIDNFRHGQTAQGFADIKFASVTLSNLEADGDLQLLPQKTQDVIVSGNSFFSQVYPVIPDIFGFTKQKHYLLLFLNNNELRPGGGFIGSYADIVIHKGSIAQFTIHDIYAADGQLQGHVDPPKALQTYMGVQNWFLRDSNFSLDPKQNASIANYFYHLETGQQVDGIITVDTNVIRQLLDQIGGVYVADYQQTVTSHNLFQLTEDHAEKGFFPGSQAKKNFLSSFSQSLQEQVTQHPLSFENSYQFVHEMFEQKHLSFIVANKADQSVIDGTFMGQNQSALNRTAKSGEVFDFFAVNEANLGGNKVNYYLKRGFEHSITIADDGTVTHVATVIYTNTSTNNSAYGGDYKSFVRFVIPQDATLTSIQINGIDQSIVSPDQSNPQYKGKTFLNNTALPVFTEQVANKQVNGFLIIVNKNMTTKLTISYTLTQKIGDGLNSYSVSLYKQSGTDQDPVSLHINLPAKFNLIDSNQMNQQFQLDTDKVLHFTFKQK